MILLPFPNKVIMSADYNCIAYHFSCSGKFTYTGEHSLQKREGAMYNMHPSDSDRRAVKVVTPAPRWLILRSRDYYCQRHGVFELQLGCREVFCPSSEYNLRIRFVSVRNRANCNTPWTYVERESGGGLNKFTKWLRRTSPR